MTKDPIGARDASPMIPGGDGRKLVTPEYQSKAGCELTATRSSCIDVRRVATVASSRATPSSRNGFVNDQANTAATTAVTAIACRAPTRIKALFDDARSAYATIVPTVTAIS